MAATLSISAWQSTSFSKVIEAQVSQNLSKGSPSARTGQNGFLGISLPVRAANSRGRIARRIHLKAESKSVDIVRKSKLRKESLQEPVELLELCTPARLATFGAASMTTVAGPALAGTELNPASASLNPAYAELGSVLEASVQFLYLGALLALLGAGSFLVVRQVLVRRELENAAKELQERVRSGQASCEEYFELGAVMLRKKFYVLANRYLEQAINKWDGDEQDLAQVHNALGFSYFSDDRVDQAVKQYEKAVKLQPGYVTAWNNLADALESKKDWPGALKAYDEALAYDPANRVATARAESLRERVQRLQGVPSKSD